MKLVADDKGRLTCAELFPPRTAFDAVRHADGCTVVLTKLEPAKPPKAKLERQNGRTVLVSDHPVTPEDVQRVMETFP